jgi:uncharacterized protein YcbK (DUF882 family)
VDGDTMTKLTKNFTIEELTFSATANSECIDNTPNDTQIGNLKQLAVNVLQPIRDKFGVVKINSGFRSRELNDIIGGVKTSQHCLGEAADIYAPNATLYDVAIWIRDNIKYDQLIYYPDKGFIHVSYRNGRLIGDTLTYVFGSYQRGLLSVRS